MTKGDLLVERGAARLHELADRAARRGDGIGEWLSDELRADAAFLRKLKPSLVKARAKGEAPTNRKPDVPPPSPPAEEPDAQAKPEAQPGPKPGKKAKKRGGPPPIVVVGAALVAGIVLAKLVDWRGHAHPRD